MMGVIKMKEYEFTLAFKLPDNAKNPENHLDALFEAGCDDALVGTGEYGYISLDFTREAEDSIEAIRNAFNDVIKAIPGATFEKASPDLVNLSDTASILGVSRQYVTKIYAENKENFPRAVYSGKTSLWHMSDVMTFLLEQNKSKDLSKIEESRDLSTIAMLLNLANSMTEVPANNLFKSILASKQQFAKAKSIDASIFDNIMQSYPGLN